MSESPEEVNCGHDLVARYVREGITQRRPQTGRLPVVDKPCGLKKVDSFNDRFNLGGGFGTVELKRQTIDRITRWVHAPAGARGVSSEGKPRDRSRTHATS